MAQKSDGDWRKNIGGGVLATEAALNVLKYGFMNLGFRRVIATVQSPNRASMRGCEKLGMFPETEFRRNDRDVVLYSIDICKK